MGLRRDRMLFASHEDQPTPALEGPRVAKPPRKASGALKTISDLYLADAAIGVRESMNCGSLAELRSRLVDVLGKNSAETRVRCARFVLKWFFPDGFDGVARKTWAAYGDEKILGDVLRYLYLSQEPVMGACVAECLLPIEVGMRVPAAVFDRFLTAYYSGTATKKTTQRLKTNLMKLGMLERVPGDADRLVSVNPTKEALLILTHSLFAPDRPRTVEVKRILANPFWKYLGFKAEEAVRAVFRESDVAGVIGKYVVADQLEQITTCWTLDEFFSHKARF